MTDGIKAAGDKAKKLATTGQTSAGSSADGKQTLRYPHDLGYDDGRETIRFAIKSRDKLDTDQQAIYLYTPPGIGLADSATYSSQDFGWIGGITQEFQNAAPQMFNRPSQVGRPDMVNWGEVGKFSGAAGQALGIAAKSKLDMKFLDMGIIKTGHAINPNQNLQFEGVGLRNFTFSFKMVAEGEDEADTIRAIENTFRKFLYPSRMPHNLILKYPPYWTIQFLKKGEGYELDENPYLPFIDLCYLRSITATYNSSTNAFHEKGQPIELDMSLSFDEAQQNTREDLYKDKEDYESAEYTRQRAGLQSTVG